MNDNDGTPDDTGPEAAGIDHLWEMEKPGPKLKPGSRRWLARYKLEENVEMESENVVLKKGVIGDERVQTGNSPRAQAVGEQPSENELIEQNLVPFEA